MTEATAPGVNAPAADTKIVTFYSYKGGAGRTMALANVAWILASAGKRVLAVDWDLESPGLHRYFRPFLADKDLTNNSGVIDILLEYQREAARYEDPSAAKLATLRREQAKIENRVQALRWDGFGDDGRIDFLGPGIQNMAYDFNVASFPWKWLLDSPDGKAFIGALRESMKNGRYDYVLIDSRTGVPDIVEICTEMLPDILVLCLAVNNQAVEGGARVVARVRDEARHDVRIIPVLTRVDLEDWERRRRRLGYARRLFRDVLDDLVGRDPETQLRYLAKLVVPYRPVYSYEEVLATFADQYGGPQALLGAYERITGEISGGDVTAMAPIALSVSTRVVHEFELLSMGRPRRVSLWAAPQDRAWKDWIHHTLQQAGIEIVTPRTPAGEPADTDAHVVVVSPHLATSALGDVTLQQWVENSFAAADADDQAMIGVRVADGPVPDLYDAVVRVSLTARDPEEARQALLERFGFLDPGAADAAAGVRFPGSPPRVWNVQNRNPYFVGREDVLGALRDTLTGGGRAGGTCAVVGSEGVGKSSVTREFAHRFGSDYDVVWWVEADEEASIRRDLAALAPKLEVRQETTTVPLADQSGERVVNAVLEALRRGDPAGRWLLVYDGASDPEALLRNRLLPTAGLHRHVIITSRQDVWHEYARSLPIAALPREESVHYLSLRLPGADLQSLDELAGDMKDIPLELYNASGSIREAEGPLDEAIRQFRHEVAARARDAGSGAAWSVTYARLKRGDDRLLNATAKLLEVLAYLSPHGASTTLVGSPEMLAHIGLPLDDAVAPADQLPQLLHVLQRHSLAEVDASSGFVRLHQVPQDQLRAELAAEGRDGEIREVALDILAAYAPPASQYFSAEQYPVYEELQNHLAAARAPESVKPEVRRWLLFQLYYLNRTGQWTNAHTLGDACLSRWRQAPGIGWDDRLTLRLATEVANTCRSLGQFDAAFELDSDTIARQRRELGVHHLHSLRTAMGLGADKRALGWYRDAWAEDQATWDGFRRLRGVYDTFAIDAAHNLALSLLLTGEVREALRLNREVLELRRRVQGADHPFTAWAQCRIAICLIELGDFDQALPLLQEAAGRLENSDGQNSHFALRARQHQAVVLRRMGDTDVAASLTESTLERFERYYGRRDPGTLACTLSRAADLHALGEHADASSLAARCLEDYQSTYGVRHPFTDVCRTNLATYRLAAGYVEQAAEDAREAYDSLGKELYPYHPFAVAAAVNYANALLAAGDVAKAAQTDKSTMSECENYLGTDHPYTRIAAANYADSDARTRGGAGGRRSEIDVNISTV